MKINVLCRVFMDRQIRNITNHMSIYTKHGWSLLSFGILLVCLSSCTEESVDVSSEPSFNLQEVITSLPGESFTITGLVSDPAGIKSVRFEYAPWSLDKVIEVDPSITQYPFEFSFSIPDTETEGSTHLINIISTNGGDKESSTQVEIVLSGDNQLPEIAMASPSDGGTYILGSGSEFNLSFTVSDNKEISTVEIVGVGLNETVEVNAASYSFDKAVDFVFAGTFDLSITATDVSGNKATKNLSVKIEESLQFEKMYLADVSSDAELVSDLFGVPMLIDGFESTDSLGVVFEANYYNSTANTEIRFIPQKASFAPFAFGAGDSAGELAIGSDATVNPIVLSEVGYYNIVINLSTMTYTIETYSPTDDTFEYIIIMGTGVKVDGASTCVSNSDGADDNCWWFGSGKPLTVDSNNPYLFSATVELYDHDPEGDGNNGFILGANYDDWSPFWRFDQGDALGVEPDATVPNGGNNYIFDESAFGTYTFVFDTHLNRVKILPQ